jgi:predicted phage tail component-like protein
MIKTYDNFKIVTQAGEMYDMADDFSVLVRSFEIGSPRPEIATEKVEGAHGAIRAGKTWGARQLTAHCSFFANDTQDSSLLRNELYRTLMNLDEFYIVVDAEPGKRWKAEVSGEFTPSKVGAYGEFTVDFVCHPGFAESVGTTLDPLTTDSEVWQFGLGLTLEETNYVPATSKFRIYNAGDVAVDPRIFPLLIQFSGVSTNLQIKNITTGDTWKYTGVTISGDTLKLDGVRSLLNETSVFGNTNRQLMTIAPGWNDFEITGASAPFGLAFDFRFYYL